MELGEALDVQFVDDRLVRRRSRRPVVSPGEGRIDDGGQRGRGGVVALVERQVLVGVADVVTEHLVPPAASFARSPFA